MSVVAPMYMGSLQKQKPVDPLQEVMDSLDILQHDQAEVEALQALNDYDESSKDTGEYEGMDNDKEITDLYDELEMIHDMNAFEREEACHELMAQNPFDGRVFKVDSKDGKDSQVSKQSRMVTLMEISERGENYGTGIIDVGKVFIPKMMLDQIPETTKYQRCIVQFKGFGECRGNQMAWRCLKLL